MASRAAAPTFTDRAWRRLADASEGRSHVAKAVVDGRIYVIGGLTRTAASAAVDRFDPATNAWSSVTSAPVPLDHAAAASLGGSIYVFGGDFGRPSARVFRYDVGSAVWTELRPMPEPRAAGGAATLDGSIFVIGGYATRPEEPLASAYRYEASTDAWERLPDLPTPRQHLAVAPYAGRACAIGGIGRTGATSAVECFDPATRRWSTVAALPAPADDFDATAVGDVLVCAGGGDLHSARVSVFDGTRWSRAPDLVIARYGVAVAAIGRTVYVLQGAATAPPYPAGVVEALTLP